MFEQLLVRLAAAFESAGIPFMVFGGQAVLVYGEPRLTRDIDISLGLSPDENAPVLATIKKIGLKILVDDPIDFVSQTFVLPALDEESSIRIDLVFTLSDYEREAIGRARKIEIHGVLIPFISPEDLVIHKVIAGRPRDLEDVKAVLVKNPDLDQVFIQKWLARFDAELTENYLERFNELRVIRK